MKNKNVKVLNEEALRQIIMNRLNEAIAEYGNTEFGQGMLGRVAAKKEMNGDDAGAKDVSAYASKADYNPIMPNTKREDAFNIGKQSYQIDQSTKEEAFESFCEAYRALDNCIGCLEEASWKDEELAVLDEIITKMEAFAKKNKIDLDLEY